MIQALAPTLAALALAPSDWPHYLGPTGDAVAPWPEESFTWPEDGPRVEWRVPIGPGFGGVAVADGEVFLQDRDRNEGDLLRVFDLESGEELWAAGYPFPGRIDYDGSRTVPTVVDRRVFTSSGFGPISCFDRDTQDLVWQVDLTEELDGDQPMFGWSAHPSVVGDVVLAAPLGPEVGLVALDQGTGDVRWRTGRIGFSHSGPTVVELGGRQQVLFITCPRSGSAQSRPVPNDLWSFDPGTGAVLWRHEIDLASIPITPPVVVDEERLLLTGGYRGGTAMLRVELGESDGADVEELWRSTRGAQCHVPIVVGDHAYLLVNENWTDSRRNRDEGGLMCVTLDGEEVWRTGDDPNFGRGGMVRLADVLLVQDGYKGALVAVRATPEGYEELGRFDPFEIREPDGQLWAPPAVAGTRLLVRSQEELVCVELAP